MKTLHNYVVHIFQSLFPRYLAPLRSVDPLPMPPSHISSLAELSVTGEPDVDSAHKLPFCLVCQRGHLKATDNSSTYTKAYKPGTIRRGDGKYLLGGLF